MTIKVLGTGCPTCQRLYKAVADILEEMHLEANIEKIEDLQQIMSYNIMSLPALVVDETVKCAGKIPSREELKRYLK